MPPALTGPLTRPVSTPASRLVREPEKPRRRATGPGSVTARSHVARQPDRELAEAEIPAPAAGEALVRNLWMSVDPYMRGRMYDRASYVPPFQIGQALFGPDNPHNGTLDFDVAYRLAQITDGTSHTLLIAEDTQRNDATWINALNLFDVAYPINQGPAIDPDIHSNHPGGADGLFADDSRKLLTDAIEALRGGADPG